MKTLLLLFIMASNSDDTTHFERVMLKNIEAFSQAENAEDLLKLSNTFERIALKETDKWEPLYYAAHGRILMAIMADKAEEKDKNLDEAMQLLEKAMLLEPKEPEILAMEGFNHMIRVTVDPPTRGQQYAGLAMQAFQKAHSIDPENPRVLLLMAQMEMGTANFFGTDTAPACEKLTQAIELFQTQKSENKLAPKWGKNQADAVIKNCK